MARNYKQEYQKFQSSPKAIQKRSKLNKINRNKGTYGNGDGLDVSHMKGGNVKLEPQSINRGNATRTPGDRRARGKKPFTANMGYKLNRMNQNKSANMLPNANANVNPWAGNMGFNKMFNIGGEVELPSVEVDMPEVNIPADVVSVPEEFSSPAMAGPGNEVEMEQEFINQQESISREEADDDRAQVVEDSGSTPMRFNDDSVEEGVGESSDAALGTGPDVQIEDGVAFEGETANMVNMDENVVETDTIYDPHKVAAKQIAKKKVIQPLATTAVKAMGPMAGRIGSKFIPGVGWVSLGADGLPLMVEQYGKGHDLAFGPSLDEIEASHGKETRDKVDATTHAYGVSGPGTGFSAKYKKGGKTPKYRVGGKIRY